MDYEDMNVFTYVENLMAGRETGGFRISQFARRHDQIDATLTELKNIIIKYYPAKGNNHLLNAVLFDIFSCEQDLASHCRVEDYLFVPAVLRLEKEGK
jgi:regulator of cell morphogenesis and NO signaling